MDLARFNFKPYEVEQEVPGIPAHQCARLPLLAVPVPPWVDGVEAI